MNDFPKEEFISRIEKIQIHIEKEEIDAVIITSPSNFRYFTGLDSNFWESPTRPWYLITVSYTHLTLPTIYSV